MAVQLHAVTPSGPVPLPVPADLRHAHELLDGLPLGVYSALRSHDGYRFLGLERHFDRTDRSMELLGWKERLDRPTLARAIDTCVRAFDGDAFVRFDVLAEPAPRLGVEERTLLALSPLVLVPEQCRAEGVVVRYSTLRREQPLVKHAGFVLQRRPYPLGSREAFEHLIVDDAGRILEGSSSNFGALLGRTLRLAGDEALQGITQRYVAELATALGLEVVREPLPRERVPELDEAFLTGSTRGIVPVVGVEEQRIGDGRPGPWTRRLIDAYAELIRTRARPAFPLEA